jgi:hypothetical protein
MIQEEKRYYIENSKHDQFCPKSFTAVLFPLASLTRGRTLQKERNPNQVSLKTQVKPRLSPG